MVINGNIVKYSNERQAIIIVAPFSDPLMLVKKEITDVEIRLNDGRSISNEQRRAVYSILRDIGDKTGYYPEECKEVMKYEFIARTGHNYFSLSDCSMTTGWQFTRFLVDFCLEQDIPTKIPLKDWLKDDFGWWVYRCLVHKRCCITQRKAQLHHVDAVGMGRDRNDIIHLGMRVLPLYWTLHAEAHRIGKLSFAEKYHIQGFKLTEELCDIWSVKY